MSSKIEIVKLTKVEQVHFDSFFWGSHGEFMNHSYEKRLEMFEHIGQLVESLLKRKAVPDHRIKYFIDPDWNFGGRGKSRKEVFEKNGTSGKAIFRHPHFVDYVKYFINGPDLPISTVHGFWKILDDDAGTSGMVLNQIQSFVRKEVRDKKFNRHHASDEFCKLALECNRPDLADIVRKAALAAR